MNSAQMTLDLVDDGGRAVHGTVAPVVGQIIHRCDLEQFDLTGCRLNWRPDNTAKVTRPEPDLTGLMRCSAASGCEVADFCSSGKPHAPDPEKDARGKCFDHKPYIVGGVWVWGTTCDANVPLQGSPEAQRKEIP